MLPLASAAGWNHRLDTVQIDPVPAARGVEGGFNRASLHALTNHKDIDCSKAQRELNYSCRPFLDTVRDTFAWFDARTAS